MGTQGLLANEADRMQEQMKSVPKMDHSSPKDLPSRRQKSTRRMQPQPFHFVIIKGAEGSDAHP